MRLLNTRTLKVEEFFGPRKPYYAILSHTWGKEEVTFQDVQTSQAEQKAGYSKLRGCCTQAVHDGYQYVWIDACCIDKTSSAELSEAINSMYKWYQEADICYVYLVDVPTNVNNVSSTVDKYEDLKEKWRRSFICSRWFIRGWTLQELIAPRVVEFYAADWTEIGTKSSLREDISFITGINIQVLDGEDPTIFSIGERLSWAASRETTRIEDAAYSLLGLFQVHMPLLYGEGESALIRLQEQILKTTEDFTLLARGVHVGPILQRIGTRTRSALARHLVEFYRSDGAHWTYSDLVLDKTSEIFLRKSSPEVVVDIIPSLTAKGLHICLPLLRVSDSQYLAYLHCKLKKTGQLMCMPLRPINLEASRFERGLSIFDGYHSYQFLDAEQLSSFRLVPMFLQQEHRLMAFQSRGFSTVSECILEADTTTVSKKCTVKTDWGFSTNVLPFTTNVLAGDVRSHSTPFQSYRALFYLDSGDIFLIHFGMESRKPWGAIFLLPEDNEKPHLINDFLQQAYYRNVLLRGFFPHNFMDRDAKMLRSNLGEVFVSTRKLSSQLVVSVKIKGAKTS